MKVQLILHEYQGIHYAEVDVPAINIGWELYVKFETIVKPKYVVVDRITIYSYENAATKVHKQLQGKEFPLISCNVSSIRTTKTFSIAKTFRKLFYHYK